MSKSLRFASFCCLSSWVALTCYAQTETLLIGPGDLVHISVFDTPEMEQHVRVTDSGTAPVMFVGDIHLGGLTPADAGRTLERALIDKQVMKYPKVTVVVEQYATQTVAVMGQVTDPGSYPIATPQSIVRVLSLAGGLTNSADRNITIERRSDPAQTVKYYYSNQANEAFSTSALVYPGDTVIVPRASVVYVLGDVNRPGGFATDTNDSQMTVLQAVAMAGSTSHTSLANKSRLIRKNSSGGQEDLPLKLADIQKGKSPDFVLQPNDVIYVPFSNMKNIAMSSAGIVSSTGSALIYVYH